MPNVNMADLRASLKGCVKYCRNHDDREYCERHLPLLEEALEDLVDSRDETDRYYIEWQDKRRSARRAWKSVAGALAQAQRDLDRVNAVGYPDQTIRYWDEELLEDVVDEMIEYLRKRTDEIEFAEDVADRLERELGKAHDELDDQKHTLRDYRRRVKKRSDAMANAAQAIMDFRELLEDELGTEHPEYEAIRWPYALSPEEAAM